MYVIGIDPHKGSHTAAVLDGDEHVVRELRVVADIRQRDRLLRFAAPFEPRTWAIESRSRIVTCLSSRESKSIVTQNGVPISSWRR